MEITGEIFKFLLGNRRAGGFKGSVKALRAGIACTGVPDATML